MTDSDARATNTVTSSERAERAERAGRAGRVSLVGGGPGDPDLVTLRAEALLAAAATVVVDACVAHLAEAFAPQAAIVPVPDRAPAVDTLLAAARADHPVVRLYAGDTWLHPAHGPEAAALAAAGIDFEAVAGVAFEIAVPALAGVPVHVRHLAIVCTIADAHQAPAATDPARTIVTVTDDLRASAVVIAAKSDPSMPAATVEMTGESTRAPVGDLAAVAPARPGVLVTGAVAATREPVLR